MKKINLLSSALALSLALTMSACASTEDKTTEKKSADVAVQVKEQPKLVPIEKMGFLTTDKCAAAGQFTDCYLQNYACGSDGCFEEVDPGVQTKVNFVLFVHAEGTTYKLDLSKIKLQDIDKSINVNDGSVIGEYNEETNTIIATEVQGPPPPKKSFFKGCL